MKKILYTAIIGNYDRLSALSSELLGDWEALCFVDRKTCEQPPWKVIEIPRDGLPAVALARKIKILSHQYVKADLSLWIDGSMRVKRPLNEFVRNFGKDGEQDAVFVRHPRRDCVYEEMDRVLELKKADPAKLEIQRRDYLSTKFPAHRGLIKSGILFRRHTPGIAELNHLWWALTEKYKTWRDQLTLPLALRALARYAATIPDSLARKYFSCGVHA